MSIKITIPNTSSDVLTFGSANTPTAAQIAGIDSGSSNGQLALYTTASGTSTEAMRINASQNVGIGTASPTAASSRRGLVLRGNANGAELIVQSTSATDGTSDGFSITTVGTDAYLFNRLNGFIAFATNNTERARIDSSGNLLVGTTTSVAPLTIGKAASQAANGQLCIISPTAGDSNISGMSIIKYANDSSTSQVLMRFLMNQGGTGQGQINANGANTAAFGSYSDSRLKENIVDLPSQLDNIMALRPVEYDYIESMGGGHQIGFVAQEVQAIYPDLVGENEDGMLTLTDMNKNDARLIKAIQEMKAIIDTQASTITQLQADVAALKGASA